jgi:integrase
MAIHKRVDTWWYRFSVNGVQYRGSCFTENEKAAQEYHDDLKSQVWRGKHLKREERRTWAETLDRWLNEHEHKRTHLGDVSFGQWWTTRFTERKIKFLDEITPDVIKVIRDRETSRPRQRNGKPIAPATVNRKIALLRAVINAAAREYQWLETAPLFRCLPEKNERVRFLTPPEIQRLLGALEEPYKSMALLAVATGLRQGNVFGLTWEQVNLMRKQMTFPDAVMKNGMALTLPINDTAMQALRPWIGKSKKYVFVLPTGESVKQLPSKMWKATLLKAGLTNLKWHDLRHTWASLMRQSGEGLDVIQELGAWQDPRMVRRYAHLSTDHLAKFSATIDRVLEQPQTGKVVQLAQI